MGLWLEDRYKQPVAKSIDYCNFAIILIKFAINWGYYPKW